MFTGSRLKNDEHYTRWLASVISNDVCANDPVFRKNFEEAIRSRPYLVNEMLERIGRHRADQWREINAPFNKPMDESLYFRLERQNGKLIHTFCDCEFAHRIGFTTHQIFGKTLHELLLEPCLSRKAYLYDLAWEGMDVIFFGHGVGNKEDEHYKCFLRRQGDELIGKAEFVTRINLDPDIAAATSSKPKKQRLPISDVLRPHEYQPLSEDMVASLLESIGYKSHLEQ